jgi:hypothetical protein
MPAPSTRLFIIIRTPHQLTDGTHVRPQLLIFNVRNRVASRERSYYPLA